MRGTGHHPRSVAVLVGLTLAVGILASCGAPHSISGLSTTTPGVTPSGLGSAGGSQPVGATVPMTLLGGSFDGAGLHAQSQFGVRCGFWSTPLGTNADGNAVAEYGPSQYLVLVASVLSFDEGTVQRMRAFVNQVMTVGNQGDWISQSPPPPLAWAAGANAGTGPTDPGCLLAIELTNTSERTIQLLGFDMRLMSAPQPNTFQYREVDLCTLSGQGTATCPPPPGSGGGPSGCSTYWPKILLDAGAVGTTYAAPSLGEDTTQGPCDSTVAPAQTVDFYVTIYSTRPLVYDAMPELTIATSAGNQVVALQALESPIVFADTSQFSCLALQGTSFTSIDLLSSSAWCL